MLFGLIVNLTSDNHYFQRLWIHYFIQSLQLLNKIIITIIHKLQAKISQKTDNGATQFDFSVGFLIQYIVLIILELIDSPPPIFTFMAPLASVSEKTPLLFCLLFFFSSGFCNHVNKPQLWFWPRTH